MTRGRCGSLLLHRNGLAPSALCRSPGAPDIGRKAISQLKTAATTLLQRHLGDEEAQELAEKLSTGTWTHDYPISAGEAKSLGLPVSTTMPNVVLELMALYPQPVRAQSGGVEYLPLPRHRETTPHSA